MDPDSRTLTWDDHDPSVTFSLLLARLCHAYMQGAGDNGAELCRRLDDIAYVINDARGPF
jgi:hypothetical protein